MALLGDYVPTQTGATRGSRGVNVRRLQNYLERFGYLDSTLLHETGVTSAMAQPPPETLGTFDEQTEEALRMFQRFVGLPMTGELDQATLDKMQQDRCGNLDVAPQIPSGYVLSGCKWDTNNLRYALENFTADLTQNQIRSAMSSAFARGASGPNARSMAWPTWPVGGRRR
jgi:peptidoglycan hydrolase-like protein with peptidoglycan-binding domain